MMQAASQGQPHTTEPQAARRLGQAGHTFTALGLHNVMLRLSSFTERGIRGLPPE
jgi:hypothetical protein